MKKIILLLGIVFIHFGVLNAQISANKTSGCAPLTGVEFTSGVAGDWDFGDGDFATNTSNPSNSYSKSGTYEVTFNDGVNPEETLTITVFGKPSAKFSLVDSTGCPPFNAVFGDSSTAYPGTTITEWQWDFGDGTGSNQQHPTHTYTNAQKYSVALTVTDNNGCDTAFVATNIVSLKNTPTASFTATPTSSCTSPLTVTINNNSTNGSGGTADLSYEWDFGDGDVSTDANPGSHTYTADGSFALKLTVTEEGGCSKSQTRNIGIGKPQAGITVPDTICIGVSTQYFNNSIGGGSFKWTFDDGGTSNQQNPFHTFNTAGDHDVTLIANASGCADTITKTVFVQEITPTLTSTPTYQCEKPYCVQFTATATNAVNWSYDYGDGNSGNEQNPEYCYTFGGDEYTVYFYNGYNYTAKVTATSVHGCYASASVADTIFPISANFAPNITQGCAPLEINFEDSSASGSAIVSYEYDFGDGNSSSTENATHTFTTAGEYEVTLTIENANGCRDTSFPIVIEVGAPIDVDLNVSPSTVCIGDSVVITDATGDARIDGYHFSTDENRGSEACPGDSIQQWSYFHKAGQHDITFYANYNGCISEKVFTDAVTVNGPSSEFKWSGICSDPTNITFTATTSQVDSIYWYFGDDSTYFSDDLADTVITHNYDTSGDYTVTLITTNNSTGCPNDTNEMVVTVRMLEAIIDADSVICVGAYTPYGGFSVDAQGDCNNTYRWDWGDGTEILLQDDPYFNSSRTDTGTYTLRLMVYDVNGCRDTAEQTVTVTDIYAGFTADTTNGCLPLTINFTDTSWSASKIVDWSWNFDDGNIDNLSGANAANTFIDRTIKDYDVKLVVTDSLGCKDSTTMKITPLIPDSNFTVSDQTICVGDEVTFKITKEASMQSATWDFGGEGSSTDLNPTFQFNNSGDYTIHVDLIDTNGCNTERTINAYVKVDDYPNAGFSINVDTTDVLCAPQTITFTDTTSFSGVTTYGSNTWNLDNGNENFNNSSDPIATYATPGRYNPEIIVRSANGCADTFSISIPIVGPDGDFDMSDNLICVGDSIQFNLTDTVDVARFSWDFGDGNTADDIDPIYHTFNSVPDDGSVTVTLILEGLGNGCPKSVDKEVLLHQVEARFDFVDSTVCVDTNVAVVNNSLTTGTVTYDWTYGPNNLYSFPTKDPLPQSYASVGPGTYEIELAISSTVGCSDTMIKEVIIHPLPTVLSNDTVMCFGEQTLIYTSGADEYFWADPNSYLDTPTKDSTVAQPESTTNFTVTGTGYFIEGLDTSRCKNTSVSNVIVYSETEREDKDTCAIIGQPFTIGRDYGIDGFIYDWSTSEGQKYLECQDCPTQTLKVTDDNVEEVVFTVNYQDPLGCFPQTNTYTVCIIDNYTVDVPSAFTPDGAGENNIVYVQGHGIEELIYFKIYNRWGELVFETNDINVGWDGIYKGNPQDMETFVYQAKVKFFNGKFEEKGGEITLIR